MYELFQETFFPFILIGDDIAFHRMNELGDAVLPNKKLGANVLCRSIAVRAEGSSSSSLMVFEVLSCKRRQEHRYVKLEEWEAFSNLPDIALQTRTASRSK